ncbi:hypothetical protein BBJ28_00006911 [Nothophytophthora sp. Chile5]|nr:hypothetical protein BBJ28_00006911 [Nothophytophthora sp. Chile5]
MSNSDDEDKVPLYSALVRNQKRHIFGASAQSVLFAYAAVLAARGVRLWPVQRDDDFEEVSYQSAKKRRRSVRTSVSPAKPKASSVSMKSGAEAQEEVWCGCGVASNRNTVSLIVNLLDEDEDEDENDDEDEDDLYTVSEREAERKRQVEIEQEVRRKLAQDKVLTQTRAIMSKISNTKRQVLDVNHDIISLDSDSDDEEQNSDDDGVVSIRVAAPATEQPTVSKGERITLHVRSNGGVVDQIPIHKGADSGVVTLLFPQNDTFATLYTSFCELHGLPQSAVQMSLDGEALSLTGTPLQNDLESGDLIDAKVDFSKQIEAKKKRYLRLRLVAFGKRSELFKIDATETVDKLHASYCKKHNIADPDDVLMLLHDQELRLSERIDFYGLLNDDEISVVVSNAVDSAAIEIQFRYTDGSLETQRTIPNTKVEVLIAKIAKARGCASSKVSLIIDGERMAASQTLKVSERPSGQMLASY